MILPLFALAAQLTTSLPKDERILEHVERGWKADFTNFVQNGIPKLAVVLVIAFILQRVVLFFVNRMRRRADHLVGNGQRAAQLRTMAAILRATAYALIGFYVIVQLLAVVGVPLGPFIASAGVIGLGISFGAQSIFKDMLTGIFILLEDQYNVGDTIKIAGLTGTVEDLSLRVTTLRDGDGTIYTVPNSQITTVSNLSRDFSVGSLSVSVDAREDPDRVVRILTQLASGLRKDEAFKDVILADPDIPGVDKITGYEVLYPINFRVRANQRDGVLRELRRRILLAFAKEKIAFGSSSSTMVIQPQAAEAAPPVPPDTTFPPA